MLQESIRMQSGYQVHGNNFHATKTGEKSFSSPADSCDTTYKLVLYISSRAILPVRILPP